MKQTYLFVLLLANMIVSAQTSIEDLFRLCDSNEEHQLDNLHDSNININARDQIGNTPLMIASKKHNFNAVRALVEAGADLNTVNQDGQTALTILRLSKISDSEEEENLWKTYLFLKDQGAIEQDYIEYIAKNVSGYHSSEQNDVLEIKQKFREFNNKINTFSQKKHSKEKGDYKMDDEPFSSDSYTARFDDSGNLVFFEHQSFENVEWHDNGMHWRRTEQYYFEDNELYFYFANGMNGSGAKYGIDREYYQYRFYIKQGKTIVASQKKFENLFDLVPKEVNFIDKLKNSKFNEQENNLSVDSIQADFHRKYNAIKAFLEK